MPIPRTVEYAIRHNVPPEKRGLFSGNPEIIRKPIRPLGEVSDYVVQQLPERIGNIYKTKSMADYARLRAEITGLVEKVATDESYAARLKGLSRAERDIALLDVMMLKAALGMPPGMTDEQMGDTTYRASLMPDTLNAFAQAVDPIRQVQTITYADVIFSNPLLTDPRTFFPLNTIEGQENFYFYEAHRRVEEQFAHIDAASRKGIQAVANHGEAGVATALQALRETGIVSREEFAQKVAGYQAEEAKTGRMTPAQKPTTDVESILGNISRLYDDMHHFGPSFRHYFDSVAEKRGGASGQYTGSVPGVELLIAGDVLPQERVNYVKYNWPYMSEAERSRLTSAYQMANKGLTLDALAYGLSERLGANNPDAQKLQGMVEGFADFVTEFRRRHMEAVRKHVPGYLKGTAAGTGGTGGADEANFLVKRKGYDLVQRPRPTNRPDFSFVLSPRR